MSIISISFLLILCSNFLGCVYAASYGAIPGGARIGSGASSYHRSDMTEEPFSGCLNCVAFCVPFASAISSAVGTLLLSHYTKLSDASLFAICSGSYAGQILISYCFILPWIDAKRCTIL